MAYLPLLVGGHHIGCVQDVRGVYQETRQKHMEDNGTTSSHENLLLSITAGLVHHNSHGDFAQHRVASQRPRIHGIIGSGAAQDQSAVGCPGVPWNTSEISQTTPPQPQDSVQNV
jgi:hypothetical protein